ncbi:MAG: helix-turn-helix domain-containing protein [Bacteroidota bacterium]
MKQLFKHLIGRYGKESDLEKVSASIQEKYKKSGLTQEQALCIKEKINHALEGDKLYRNNEIGLGELANYIQQDRYKVSEVINTYYAMNFYALLNNYRINEAKHLLVSNPVLSVKAIMYEVGFNSKNSFYLAFKRDTGLCPNDFRTNASYNYHSPPLAS